MKALLLALLSLLVPALSSAQDPPAIVSTEMPDLLATYKNLHRKAGYPLVL
jgi:hypothetical protein